MSEEQGALTEVIEELEEASEGGDRVKVGQLIDALCQNQQKSAIARRRTK